MLRKRGGIRAGGTRRPHFAAVVQVAVLARVRLSWGREPAVQIALNNKARAAISARGTLGYQVGLGKGGRVDWAVIIIGRGESIHTRACGDAACVLLDASPLRLKLSGGIHR
jgi:hypothetical protein